MLAGAATLLACSSGPAAPAEPSAVATEALTAQAVPDATFRVPLGLMPMRKPGAPSPDLGGVASNYCTMTRGQAPSLKYFGGQVIQNVGVVDVNWSSTVPAITQTQMPLFYAAITKSAYMDGLDEYDTVGAPTVDGQPGTSQGIARGSLVGTATLAPSLCPDAAACTVTDAQVSAELAAQITAGKLPAPVKGCDGFASTIYMIDFPANVTIQGPDNSGQSCAAFCGYHFSFHYAGLVVPYAVLPDLSAGPCGGGACGANATFIQNATAAASHELAEAVTDADVGDVTTLQTTGYSRPAGWGDNNCGEIGDICAYQDAVLTVNGTAWTVQQEWSNAQNDCVTTHAPTPPCTGPNTPAGCRVCTCTDNGINCTGAAPWCETLSSNVKYGDCVQCTTTAECPAADVCSKSATPAQDDVCTCVPKTACPAGQNCGTASNGCGGTIVCGTCMAPQTCGGSGTANQCGCTPATTCTGGQNCGTAGDGCGGMIACGTCTPPQTCGGGGAATQCGCTPKTTCPAGDTCGTADNGCSGTVTCGTCTAGQTCTGNTCVDNVVDAGQGDAALVDAGQDAAPGNDASTPEAGTDGGIVPGPDAAMTADAAGIAADAGDQGTSGTTGGCGCRTALPVSERSSPAFLGFGAFAMIAGARLRRKRRS